MSITMSNDVAGIPQSRMIVDPDGMRSEVNHRIGNSLSMIASLIRVQARDLSEHKGEMNCAEVQSLLTGIGIRIEAVASLHRRLSTIPQSAAVFLFDYLSTVCEDMVATLAARGQVSLSLDIDEDLEVSNDLVLPMLWIVSEIVTNSIKYAHPAGSPGKIGIFGRQESDGTLSLDIADDGVGLPEGFDPETDGGLGFRLVRALAHQIGGRVSFNTSGIGLDFRLRIPAPGGSH